jgi:hypothetical protein
VNAESGTCTCPDFEIRRKRCKHVFAVEFCRAVETAPDGSQVVTESVKLTRKTYTENWPAYNAAQTQEGETIKTLLRALCDTIAEPPRSGPGRRPVSLADSVFAMATKVYSGMSGRRATTDIEACAADGHMSRAPKYNTILFMFDDPKFTPIVDSADRSERQAAGQRRDGVRDRLDRFRDGRLPSVVRREVREGDGGGDVAKGTRDGGHDDERRHGRPRDGLDGC